ncbi:MAG: hypothetical protein K2H85_08375, partial [Allobaculum sp.]|nr:hypothetical protein [Allobaculum sp.]
MIREEVSSHYDKFRSNSVPANYIGVGVNEVQSFNMESLLGVTVRKDSDSFRQFSVNVKIGTPQSRYFRPLVGGVKLDCSYSSEERFDGDLAHLRTVVSDRIQSVYDGMPKNSKAFRFLNDSIPDLSDVYYYSRLSPSKYYELPLYEEEIDMNSWESLINEVCSVFRVNDYDISASVTLRCKMERKYLVTSDGIEVVTNNHSYLISISAHILTEDGEKIPLINDFFFSKKESLPSKAELRLTAEEMLSRLQTLYAAPCIDSYDGPVLFGGIATGVLMHEIIGHRLESVRSQNEMSAVSRHMNSKVFADFIQISDNPTMKEYATIPLVGYYLYDDEGVPAQKLECIKNGTLASYLTSRTPFYEGSVSNGHGRGEFTKEPTARQANLFVSSSKPYADSLLRAMLVTEIKKQDKEYGYYIP